MRRLIALLLCIFGGTFFSGCERAPSTPLRIGITTWPGDDILLLARQLGYLDETRTQIADFPGTPEIHRSFQNRAIEAAVITLDEALQLGQTQPDLRIVMAVDFSNGADALLGKPNIKTLADLKGKRVGVELNALGGYMLARALERAGLTAQDITIVQSGASEHLQTFTQDEVDAIITYEPTRSKLRSLGANQLFDSSEIPGEIADVVIVHKDVLRERKEEVKQLLRGWFRAINYFKSQPAEGAKRLALRQGVSPNVCLEGFSRVELLDYNKNKDLFDPERGGLSDTMRRLSAVMVKHQLLEKMIEPGIFLEGRCVREITP